MNAKHTRELWCNVVNEKFRDEREYYQLIMAKLKRMKFAYDKPKHGKHSSGKTEDNHCVYCYTRKHFPSLLRLFAVKLQASQVPGRVKRTRLEHHPAKQDQLRLVGGNQLDLF